MKNENKKRIVRASFLTHHAACIWLYLKRLGSLLHKCKDEVEISTMDPPWKWWWLVALSISLILFVTLFAIWYHLCNLKNVRNTHGAVLFLIKLQASAQSLTVNLELLWKCMIFAFSETTFGAIWVWKMFLSNYSERRLSSVRMAWSILKLQNMLFKDDENLQTALKFNYKELPLVIHFCSYAVVCVLGSYIYGEIYRFPVDNFMSIGVILVSLLLTLKILHT